MQDDPLDPTPRDPAPGAPVSRRAFLAAAAAGGAALGGGREIRAAAGSESPIPETRDLEPEIAEAAAKLGYLTPLDGFREFVREKPRIDELPPERLKEVGLVPETWKLEVVADPASDSKLESPLARDRGTALDWAGLMELAETRAVRYLALLGCTNIADPLGMGLWEGVPLRDVIWMARPTANARRVWYHGFHNDVPAQRFTSSLTMSRVLEDPPGELPVILCYKLNGQWLSAKHGGPVRLLVPGTYANKSVKWLQRILLTNDPRGNDTYAEWNNDVESPLKTCARFLDPPSKARAGEPLVVLGFAQVGSSGLRRVQWSLHLRAVPLSADDPRLEKLEWKDASILPPPRDWGGGLPEGKLPDVPLQVDPATGAPRSWPLRWTRAPWGAVLKGLVPGAYDLRCRTIDEAGAAQPLPRPLPRSGENRIQSVPLDVS